MSDAYSHFLSLTSIDRLLDEHQKNPDLFTQLYQKKVKLLDAINNKKIDAKNYALICKKLLNEEKNEDIKTFLDMQLTMLMEGEQQEWFNEILQESKQEFQNQKKIFEKFSKNQVPSQSKASPVQEKAVPKNISASKNKSTTTLQVDKIFSLKLLDTMMESATPQMFLKLFAQKEKLIGLMTERKLIDKVYFAAVKRMLGQGASYGLSEDDIGTVQMELDLLNDLHDGNLEEWFKDVVDATGQCYEDQTARVNQIKSGKTNMKKKKSDLQDLNITEEYTGKQSVPQSFKMKETVTRHSNEPKKVPSKLQKSKFICFKYLEKKLTVAQSNPESFCELFEEKQKIIGLMQNQKLTPELYRNGLTKLIKQSTNQEEKEAAEEQIDLNDLTGDVDQFFQSTVNDFGEHYQQQKELYEKLKNKKKTQVKDPTGPSALYEEMIEEKSKKQKIPKPNVSDIVSFQVIIQLLTTFKKDYDYCLQLKAKGKKLYALVQQKRLGPNQYKQFLKSKLQTVEDKQLIKIMKRQMKEYENSSNSGKVFNRTVKEYLEKVKVDLGKRRSFDEQFEIDQNMINELSKDIQVQYLIRKLGKYESLLAYFRNNKLDQQFQSFKKQYDLKKDEILQLCERLKEGNISTKHPEENKEKEQKDQNVEAKKEEQNKVQMIDLRDYVETHLPDITFGMFQRITEAEYIQKIDQIISELQVSAKQYMQYTKKLKKGSNRVNIEEGNKYKESIVAEIQYLNSLKKNKSLVPLPLVEIKKEEMYNMDLNTHLSENDIEIIINEVDGIPGNECILRIFMINMKQCRYKANVRNGQNEIKTIVSIPPEKMYEIIKGTQKKYLAFKFSSKGWFGESSIDEVGVELTFIKSNIMTESVTTNNGKINVKFTAKVYKPKKPLITQVKIVKILKKYDEYKHSKLVENQFLKSVMPFENPTKSQILH